MVAAPCAAALGPPAPRPGFRSRQNRMNANTFIKKKSVACPYIVYS